MPEFRNEFQYLRHLKKRACAFDRQSKDRLMPTRTAGLSVPFMAPVITASEIRAPRRRHINPQAGHALELLGHAIEYLTDELVHEASSISAHDPQLEAVQLLMACNRKIYFACPEIPTLSERFRALLHGYQASAH